MKLKFDPGYREIEEYLSQIDSILRVNLTRYWESIWLDIDSQFDSILRVNLTRYWELIWLDIESQFDSNILQLLRIPGQILVLPVTRIFRSKWLPFSSQWHLAPCGTQNHVSKRGLISYIMLAKVFAIFKTIFQN